MDNAPADNDPVGNWGYRWAVASGAAVDNGPAGALRPVGNGDWSLSVGADSSDSYPAGTPWWKCDPRVGCAVGAFRVPSVGCSGAGSVTSCSGGECELTELCDSSRS